MDPLVGSTLIGGALGFMGQKLTNDANVNAQYAANAANTANTSETNRSNREIANAQMEFQREMSNTAHQREMSDLKAAGLNPLLAVTKGAGASTPTGSSIAQQAARVDAPRIENALGKGAANAMDAMNMALMAKELQNKDTVNQLTNAQIAKTIAETGVVPSHGQLNIANADLTRQRTLTESVETKRGIQNYGTDYLRQQALASQMGAIAQRAKADEARASIEAKNTATSFWLNKAEQGAGIVSDVSSVFKPFGNRQQKPLPPRDNTPHNTKTEYYDAKGEMTGERRQYYYERSN